MIKIDAKAEDLVVRSKKLYQEKLRALLEPEQIGNFVAIEPDTESYFVAGKSIDALLAGRAKFPDKLFFLIRVGYPTAHKMGGYAKRNSDRLGEPGEARLYITFANGKNVECVIDTGFSGELSLPAYLFADLDLQHIGYEEIYGIGQYAFLGVIASANIIWFGVEQSVEVVLNDGDDMLVGTELLLDTVLRINYRNQKVTITRLPPVKRRSK